MPNTLASTIVVGLTFPLARDFFAGKLVCPIRLPVAGSLNATLFGDPVGPEKALPIEPGTGPAGIIGVSTVDVVIEVAEAIGAAVEVIVGATGFVIGATVEVIVVATGFAIGAAAVVVVGEVNGATAGSSLSPSSFATSAGVGSVVDSGCIVATGAGVTSSGTSASGCCTICNGFGSSANKSSSDIVGSAFGAGVVTDATGAGVATGTTEAAGVAATGVDTVGIVTDIADAVTGATSVVTGMVTGVATGAVAGAEPAVAVAPPIIGIAEPGVTTGGGVTTGAAVFINGIAEPGVGTGAGFGAGVVLIVGSILIILSFFNKS